VVVKSLDALSPHLRGRVQERMQSYVAERIGSHLRDLIALAAAAASTQEGGLNGLARGVAFRLVENFGAMSRAQFGDELKQLDQSERAKLRGLGVRFGEYTLFMPALLKPTPARLSTLLWALWTDRDPIAFQAPKAGLVSMPARDLPHAYYYAIGYRPSGARAVRIDMLERLAQQIRAGRKDGEHRGGFEASQQMMSIVGCSGEDFEAILGSLGYRKHTIRVKRAALASAPEATATPVEVPTAPADSEAAEAGETAAARQAASPIQAAGQDIGADDVAVGPAAPAGTSEPAGAETAPGVAAGAAVEEKEIVVWRLAPRRPSAPRRDSRGDEQRRGERKLLARDAKRQPREGRKAPRREPRAPMRNPQMSTPQHRRVADPNSPFAVLAALKDELVKREPLEAGPEKEGS
jgi:ATP-dependent RNA helicase SUPV3L1/SUV3